MNESPVCKTLPDAQEKPTNSTIDLMDPVRPISSQVLDDKGLESVIKNGLENSQVSMFN